MAEFKKVVHTDFFTASGVIKKANKELFDKAELYEITHDEAAVASNKLWIDFIHSFHYPHEHGYRYETNELKDNNTQPLNAEQK